jgi:hypothetical protein
MTQCARDVILSVLLGRQDLHQLGASRDELCDLVASDQRRHV